MATGEKVITDYPYITKPSNNDIILIVHDPNGVPSTKIITYQNFYSNVSVDVSFSGNVTASGTVSVNTLIANNLVFGASYTPVGNADVRLGSNTIWFDNNYLYVAVSNTSVKRVQLQDF